MTPNASIASTLRKSQHMMSDATSNKQMQSLLESTGLFNDSTKPLSMHRQLKMDARAKPKILYIEAEESEDDSGGAFTANPADDIPRNKLTEKLTRGIQSFVQRMQKREGFRAEVRTQVQGKTWIPPPRESATITSSGYNAYMLGGMNCEPIKEIVRAKVMGD